MARNRLSLGSFCAGILIAVFLVYLAIDRRDSFYSIDRLLAKSFDANASALAGQWGRLLDKVIAQNASSSDLDRVPHLQDCKRCSEEYRKLDWINASKNSIPWIVGTDEDNLPETRRIQRDIWLHQHPQDCSNAKFLMADWHSRQVPYSIGVGSELVSTASMLGLAIKENRVLVTKPYYGADHEGCVGSNRSRWSCYFVPEASHECIERALQLSSQKKAWEEGILKNYDGSWQWTEIPSLWGEPWKEMQPSVELDGKIMRNFDRNNLRWWRSQAFRYLMRFPSEYLCNLLNRARHEAFGEVAAQLVMDGKNGAWTVIDEGMGLEFAWKRSFGGWMPRPLVSVHVRQGDKAREMKVHSFKDYMKLAMKVQASFPQLKDVWLSTEMQDVVEDSMHYRGWNFYYTNIPRQTGTTSMADYMASLGKRATFDNSFVNLMMASQCDFFVGALGSTWSYIIDNLRMTNGKVNAGFLTVTEVSKYL